MLRIMGVTPQCQQLRTLDPTEDIKASSQCCREGNKTDQGDRPGTNRHINVVVVVETMLERHANFIILNATVVGKLSILPGSVVQKQQQSHNNSQMSQQWYLLLKPVNNFRWTFLQCFRFTSPPGTGLMVDLPITFNVKTWSRFGKTQIGSY